MLVRTIVEETPKNLVVMDVFSKLSQERIVFIGESIDDDLANGVIAQLLYLDSLNYSRIDLYINSPGGNVSAGLAIYDVANLIKSPIRTIGLGSVASMATILLLVGKTRVALPHTRIMLHQINSGTYGTIDDFNSHLSELNFYNNSIEAIISEKTKITDFKESFKVDTWFGVEECLENGILTEPL